MKTANVKIPKLRDGSHRQAGSFDNASRWYPSEECRVDGAFSGRCPSRAWPYSYLKHYYTAKYSKLLLAAAPELWLSLQGLKTTDPAAAPYLSWYAAHRMQAAA